MRGTIVALMSGLLSTGCSVFGIRTEPMPAYTVERTIGPADARVELRHYGPRLAAETTVTGPERNARSDGFKILAGYIFGDNGTRASIEMTAPVAQSRSESRSSGEDIAMSAPVAQSRTPGGQWRIRFFMPAPYTLDTLPRPNNPAVTLVTVPAETVAALRYAGSIGPDSVHSQERRLLEIVRAAGLRPEGDPSTWFYDPPWTLPPLRRNEAVVLLTEH